MGLCRAFVRRAWRWVGRSAAVAGVGLAALGATGCSPTLDWRTVRYDAAPVAVTLPCKPERGARDLPLFGVQHAPVTLHMLSCEAAGHTFAVAAARLPDDGTTPAALQRWVDDWQRANWAALQVTPGPTGAPPDWMAVPCRVAGATWTRCWRGPGRTPAGASVQAQLQWASDGRWLVQSALYGPGLAADAHETYFAGITWR
ncbi:hypothetical protein [Tepidimonas thermarum]|uniref:hypothetical protein n=1 Tax=Tepidimonas thermarum TaxID=335431 RepID=UPI00117E977D|nr:hypothetical protein [Tepidimonas thermarum]